MKIIKKLVCAAAALLLLAQTLSVTADDTSETDRFDNKTWDEIIEEFLKENNIPEDRIALGYKNTVTGEEHYFNGDSCFMSASLFKVPLNMVYTDRIFRGEMTMEDKIGGVSYRYCLETTIVDSSNEMAYLLWDNLGSFADYRREIAPYMGVDPDDADPIFLKENVCTARQMIYCLDLLYTESERFDGIIDLMLLAKPDEYFKSHEQSVPVAHKYGYIRDTEVTGHLYINDSAVVYTEDPIVIVMLTATLTEAEERLADYCTLMIDYTQYHTQLRQKEERKAAECTPTPSPTPVPDPVLTPTPPPAASPEPTPAAEKNRAESGMVIGVASAVLLLAGGCAGVSFSRKRRK